MITRNIKIKALQNQLLSIQRNMLNFAYALTSDRDDAYDLMQDTTLKVLDNQDKFVDDSNFKGWVFTIMRNIFINQYRRNTRVSMVVDQSDDSYIINDSAIDESATPEDTYAVQEIMNAVNAFPDEYRVPFSMYLRGYHYYEIADYMRLPVGTVKSRIFFARRRLRVSLADYRR